MVSGRLRCYIHLTRHLMKVCPHCKKCYDDEMFFCLDDGTPLSAAGYQVDPTAPTEVDIPFGGAAKTEVLPRREYATKSAEQAGRSTPAIVVPVTQDAPTPVTKVEPKSGSAISYLIIGALGAICLMLAGVLLFMNRGLILGTQPGSNVVAANSNRQTVNASVIPPSTTPNAVNTVKNEVAKPTPTPLSPSGRWKGEWSTESGTLLDFDLSLAETDNGRVEGQIRWTMRKTVRPDKMDKVGLSAIEFVRGTFEPDGSVTLTGYRKDDPDNLLVLLDQYRLQISPDAKSLNGLARNGGKWNGRVRLSRTMAGS